MSPASGAPIRPCGATPPTDRSTGPPASRASCRVGGVYARQNMNWWWTAHPAAH
ncbi:trp operon leader peptide [Streptomyces sp. HD1123-B1]|uniref:trp operon leader peptide n=1 Tax=Streptomyces huangiella TaxID=3228804 RepID=UPI003D7EEA93